jgi:Tol biopolymer transport system component
MKKTFYICALVALLLAAAFAHAQQITGLRLVIKEKLLGRVPEGAVLSLQLVSPDSSRFVYVVKRGDKSYVAVNGKLGPAFDVVAPRTMRFSPDDKRFVYAARRGPDWFLVRDGKAQKIAGEPAAPAFAPNPLFSPDSRHLALVLKQGDMFSLVMDGVEFGRYASVNGLTFSPDSHHWAFSTGHGDKSQIITDSGPGPEYKTVSLPLFSADNRRLGYVASRGAGEFTVIDGAEGKVYEAVDGLTFSPDGRRIAFQTKTKEHLIMAVVDGQEHKGYKGGQSSPILFSPDSSHVAYVASDGDNSILVLDAVEQKAYPGIFFMTFSPDSRHLLLKTKAGAQDVVVVDGKEGKPYPSILQETITFSPTGRLAYRATVTEQRPVEGEPGTTTEVDKEAFIVADGVEGTRFPAVNYPSFSADGTYLAYTAMRDNGWRLVVNGVEGNKTYDAFMGSHRPEFISRNRVRFVGIRQAEVFRVGVRITAK